MRNPETMLRVYEELANRFAKQNEPRFRDHCLVLAADAALSAERLPDAERLRQRLLQVNPHHLLRPFASMTEAMQAPDVQEYVTDLRRQWPAEFAQKLYLGGPDQPAVPETTPPPEPDAPPRPVETALPRRTEARPAERPAVFKPAPIPEAPAPKRAATPLPARPVAAAAPAKPARVIRATASVETPEAPPSANPMGQMLAALLLLVGIAGAAGLFFLAFVWPLLD